MMLPRVPGKERRAFLKKIFSVMLRHGIAGLSEEECETLKGELRDILDQARPGDAADDVDATEAVGGG
jgi:hypothetical protein